MVKKSCIEEAGEIRAGNRQADYGDAVENFSRISEIAKVAFDLDIKPEDIAKVMISIKLSREKFNHKRDNLVDMVGYIDILNEIKEHEND